MYESMYSVQNINIIFINFIRKKRNEESQQKSVLKLGSRAGR